MVPIAARDRDFSHQDLAIEDREARAPAGDNCRDCSTVGACHRPEGGPGEVPAYQRHSAATKIETRQRFVALSDSVSDGVLVYDSEGRLLHRNRAAAAMLEQDGHAWVLDEAARCARSLAEHFRSPLPTFRGAGASALSTTTRAGGGRYRLTATASERGLLLRCAAIVTVIGASRLGVGDDLRQRYQLTAREAAVVGLLTQGRSNSEVAVTLGIDPHTARHHTQRVLEKLGVHSRAEVPKLLLDAHDAEVAHSLVRD